MKIKSYLSVLALAGAIVAIPLLKPAQAQQSARRHSCVIFNAGGGNGSDLRIYYLSKSGPDVPEIDLDPAVTVARLQDAGFTPAPGNDPFSQTWLR